MKTFELTPVNGRKFFYGKCKVIEDGSILRLQSDDTIVAEYETGTKQLRILGYESTMTGIHINAFLDYLGMPTMTKKEILESI